MGSGIPTDTDFESGAKHPVVRRFPHMFARPDLRSVFPGQFEKHWENKGVTGIVQIIRYAVLFVFFVVQILTPPTAPAPPPAPPAPPPC
jgi:hypothetical protein